MEKYVLRLFMTAEAKAFMDELPSRVREKVRYNMHRIVCGERNAELFKKIEGTDIWEFRTLYNRVSYRLFAFWDKDKNALIVVTHGIVKKTQKTPAKEIAKAEGIMKHYFELKYEKL